MKIHAIILTAALFGGAMAGFAEEQTSATLDGKNITVKYAAPRGRCQARRRHPAS